MKVGIFQLRINRTIRAILHDVVDPFKNLLRTRDLAPQISVKSLMAPNKTQISRESFSFLCPTITRDIYRSCVIARGEYILI